MSTLPWLIIPGFLVPLLATTHIAIFHRLRAHRAADVDAGAPAHAGMLAEQR
jgi:hypothetical protein